MIFYIVQGPTQGNFMGGEGAEILPSILLFEPLLLELKISHQIRSTSKFLQEIICNYHKNVNILRGIPKEGS